MTADQGGSSVRAGGGDAPLLIQLDVGLLQNFVTIIGCPASGAAAVVDPAFELDRVLAEVARHGWRVTALLVTHTHIDHVEAVEACASVTGAPAYVGAAEAAALAAAAPTTQVVPVNDGDLIPVGQLALVARATPGHTSGGVTFVGDGFAVTGDVLFVGSCGRSDLGGDPEVLYRTLTQVIAALPEETRIYPGHDYGPTPTSTIGWELAKNPCFQQPDEAAFVRWQAARQRD